MTTSETTIRAYIDAYNAFDIGKMCSLMHDDILFENITGEAVNLRTSGLDEFRQTAEQGKVWFSERLQTIKRIEDAGSHNVVEISYTAIVAVDLPNGLKKGDDLSLEGVSHFYITDGKISILRDFS
ncbi:MAG: hypothetical protein B7X50_11290 [Alishewanella sp. 34-51-39]|nr:MAG: hypothetical protein B7X50_11290 [Alishewanella sp. 34-51-39]